MTIDQIPIGKFSVLTRISPKALRYYDGKGLLVPETKDSITGYRYYTAGQLERGVKIRTLTLLGFSLDDIAVILRSLDDGDIDSYRMILNKQLSRTRAEISRLERIESLLENPDEMIKMTLTEPVEKQIPQLRILSKTQRGSISELMGELVGDVMGVIYHPDNQRNLVKMTGPLMTLYHDPEPDLNDRCVDVAVPITGKISLTDPEAEVRNLPATPVLSLVHKGPYDSIGLAYQKLIEYANARNIELTGPFRELYLNDPNVTDPEDIMTEIQAPLK